MHNHVLADVGQSYVDAVGCRSSGFPSDQSEDSDYDTIWITHTNRIGSMSRKSCCSYIHIKIKTLFFFYFVWFESDELFLRALIEVSCSWEHIEEMVDMKEQERCFHRTEAFTFNSAPS